MFLLNRAFASTAVVALGLSTCRGGALDAGSPQHTVPGIPAVPTEGGYLKLSFDRLAAFPFTVPAFESSPNVRAEGLRAEEQIPPDVRAFDGRKAIVTGYMAPMKTENGKVTELMLMRYAFAAGNVNDPTINEWVIVRIKSGVPPRTLLPVSFFGVFKVGVLFERGYVVGIYELEAERMSEIPLP